MPHETPSLLSASWVNERVDNVLDRVDSLLDRIIFEGLLSSGYAPLSEPITKDLIKRMTPQQVIAVLGALKTPEERIKVLEMLDLSLDTINDILGIRPGQEL